MIKQSKCIAHLCICAGGGGDADLVLCWVVLALPYFLMCSSLLEDFDADMTSTSDKLKATMKKLDRTLAITKGTRSM